MRPLLSLVMMVRDEAASIRQVLEAALPHVDRWSIVDTGSKDMTKTVIREVTANAPAIGRLYDLPFEGYAETRNAILDLDEKGFSVSAEFTLMLSGDEFLRNGEELRAFLETQRTGINLPGAYKIPLVIEGDRIAPHRVFRTGSGWHYEDAGIGVHEFAAHADPNAPVGVIPGAWIEHIVSDPEKRFENIWTNHIPLLKSKLDPECGGDPDNPRALLFLANSYKALFAGFHPSERVSYAMEAMSLYLRRLALPFTTDHERNYVRLCYLDCARLTEVYTPAETYARVEELAKVDPQRPETALLRAELAVKACSLAVVYGLAAHAAQVATDATTLVNDSPVSLNVAWRAHHLAAVAAKQLAQKHPEDGMRTEYAVRAKEHVQAGITSGGQPHLFDGIIPGESAVL